MCIFCKIINKEIPSYTLFEDEHVIAILDISQVTKGHTLVIPKLHSRNMLECDNQTLSHCIQIAKELAVHLVDKTQALGCNILTNVGEAAGQTVDHFHIHIVPRFNAQDAIEIKFRESKKIPLEELYLQLKK